MYVCTCTGKCIDYLSKYIQEARVVLGKRAGWLETEMKRRLNFQWMYFCTLYYLLRMNLGLLRSGL